ncbi:MAG: FliM/FliN family flagellar motor switch protein [Pseudomonadota bacterium]
MVKDKKKNIPEEEFHEDIDLFEDFEEPTEVKKNAPRDDSITDELPTSPEHTEPAEQVFEDDLLSEEEFETKAKKNQNFSEEVLAMSSDIPVQLVAVIGKTTISVKDLMNYQMGQVIDLGRPPGETVDLVASGKLFARGELVDIDGKLGVRIIKLTR